MHVVQILFVLVFIVYNEKFFQQNLRGTEFRYQNKNHTFYMLNAIETDIYSHLQQSTCY